MTNKKNTRRALFMSITSLILCCAMLMGTTFAWFTDEVKSGRNQIAAGNLDVELYNDDGKVTANTVLFNDVTPALWEPGAVAFENLQVKNEGTLALKYNLNLTVLNETEVNGHRLSEVIKVGIVDGGITGMNRDTIVGEVNTWVPLNKFNMNMSGVKLEAGQKSSVFGVVLYWQPNSNEIDNLYNMNNANTGKVLQLDIGVELLATQEMHENDSFGSDYDANAPYDSWDGTVPAEMPETLVVDGETQTIHIKDAAALVYMSTLSEQWAELYTDRQGTDYSNYANGAGTNYYYSSQWTVSLESNIDLNNQQITPIKIEIGQNTGASAFNGNGHVIRNVNTTTGLFADNNRITYSNFALENVSATNGALAGSVDGDVTGVAVNNATISGVDYVGGLVGYSYGEVKNCKVMNSSVTASGKEAGGLIGYVATSKDSAEVYNNEVYNVSVHANNRAAGLVAQANVNVKVYNNTIDSVTISAAETANHTPNAVVSNALAPENVYNNTVKNATVLDGNTALHPGSGLIWNGNSGNHEGVYFICSADDLKKAVSYFAGQTNSNEANTATFELKADIDMAGKSWEPWSVMFITVNGNGHTISNLSNSLFSYAGGVKVNKLTLENVKASGNQAATFAAVAEGATFENCVLKGNNTVTYVDAGKNENGVGAISGVTINSKLNVIIDTNATVTLNKGAIKNTEKTVFEDDLYGYKHTTYSTNSGTITNNGTIKVVYSVSTAADLDSMLNEGKNVTLEQDLKFNASETTANSGYKGNTGVSVKGGVLDGNGNTLTVTDANQTWGCAIHTTGGTIKNLTVSGAMRGIFTGGISKDLYIDNVTFKDVIYTFNSDGTKGSCANYGVYISNSTLNGWTSFSDMFKEVVITNCSFGEGSGYAFFRPYGSTEFINCNFAKGYEIDAVGVITFENCTLNGAPLTAENLATLVTSNFDNASVK